MERGEQESARVGRWWTDELGKSALLEDVEVPDDIGVVEVDAVRASASALTELGVC